MPQWKDVLKNDLYEDRVIEVAVAKLKDMGGSNIRVGNTSLTAKFEFRDIANFSSHIEITWRRTLPLAKKKCCYYSYAKPEYERWADWVD